MKYFGDNIHPNNMGALRKIGWDGPGFYKVTPDYYLVRQEKVIHDREEIYRRQWLPFLGGGMNG